MHLNKLHTFIVFEVETYQHTSSTTVVSNHILSVATIMATKGLLLSLLSEYEKNIVYLSLELHFWTTSIATFHLVGQRWSTTIWTDDHHFNYLYLQAGESKFLLIGDKDVKMKMKVGCNLYCIKEGRKFSLTECFWNECIFFWGLRRKK